MFVRVRDWTDVCFSQPPTVQTISQVQRSSVTGEDDSFVGVWTHRSLAKYHLNMCELVSHQVR